MANPACIKTRTHFRFKSCWYTAAVILLASRVAATGGFQVSTNFESGSAQILERDSGQQRLRISPGGDPKRGMPNWWFVRITDLDTNKPFTLQVVAREEPVPGSDNPKQLLTAGWALPDCAAVSTDGASWKQTLPGERNRSESVYQVPAGPATLWLAWGPPFTPHDSAVFVERIAREHPSFATAFTLARSREDRPVPALRVVGGDLPTTNRFGIWLNARHHAWECGSSWVGIGFIEWLVSDDPEAKWLRENGEIYFVPVMDVDHVATGDGGKMALPQDHIRDWSAAPHWPEVAAAQGRILAMGKRTTIYLDLHNGAPSQRTEGFYVPYPPYVPNETVRLHDRFFDCVRRTMGEVRLMDGKPNRPEEIPIWRNSAAPWVREHCGSKALAFTVETAWNTPQGTPEGYRDVGRKLGLAIAAYLHTAERP